MRSHVLGVEYMRMSVEDPEVTQRIEIISIKVKIELDRNHAICSGVQACDCAAVQPLSLIIYLDARKDHVFTKGDKRDDERSKEAIACAETACKDLEGRHVA